MKQQIHNGVCCQSINSLLLLKRTTRVAFFVIPALKKFLPMNKCVTIPSMNYIIDYYSNDLQTDILNLPEGLLAKYFTLSERMEYHWANLGEPHTKAMGDGLFELRLKSTEGIARVFYCT